MRDWEHAGLELVRAAVAAMPLGPKVREDVQALIRERGEAVSSVAGHVLRARADVAPSALAPVEFERQVKSAWRELTPALQGELSALAELLAVEQDAERREDAARLLAERLARALCAKAPLGQLLGATPRPAWIGWALLFAGLFLLKTYVLTLVNVTGGGMAPSLLGEHLRIECPSCQHVLQVGVLDEEFAERDRLTIRYRCPLCAHEGSHEAREGQLRAGSSLLVLRLARTPARWECWEHEREGAVFVKRVVGLAGERLEVRNGDLFVDGAIARKPDELLAASWLPVYDARKPGPPAWRELGAAGGWTLDEPRRLRARAGAPWLELARPITSAHGYDRLRAADAPVAVADLRVTARVSAAAVGSVSLAVVEDERALSASFPVGEGALTLSADGVELARAPVAPLRLGASHTLQLAVADDRARVWLDGALALEFVDADAPRAWCRRGTARLHASAGEVVFADVLVERDGLHYLPRPQAPHDPAAAPREVPAGHVFLLGDNSATSSDSRSRGPLPSSGLRGRVIYVH